MPFKELLARYEFGHSRETVHLTEALRQLPFTDEATMLNPKVKDVVGFTPNDWLRCRNMGKKSLTHLSDIYERVGLKFGMMNFDIFQDESTDSPTLSFQDYINHLKQFADKAGACAITNELYTDDGYKITFKVEKVKQ